MKKYLSQKVLGLLTLAVLGGGFHSPSLHAQPAEGGRMKELNLSEEQRTRIKEIRQKYKAQREALKQESLQEKREELKKGLAGNASKESLKALFDELKAAKEKRAELRFNQMLEVREVLNPDQRSKIAQKFDGQGGRREGRRGGKMGGGKNRQEN